MELVKLSEKQLPIVQKPGWEKRKQPDSRAAKWILNSAVAGTAEGCPYMGKNLSSQSLPLLDGSSQKRPKDTIE